MTPILPVESERWGGVFWIGGLSHTPNAESNPSRGVRIGAHDASIGTACPSAPETLN